MFVMISSISLLPHQTLSKLCQNLFFYYSLPPFVCSSQDSSLDSGVVSSSMQTNFNKRTHSHTITGKFQLLSLLEDPTRNTSHCSAAPLRLWSRFSLRALSRGTFPYISSWIFYLHPVLSSLFAFVSLSCRVYYVSLHSLFSVGWFFIQALPLTGFLTRNRTLFLFYFAWKDIFRGRRARYVYISLQKGFLSSSTTAESCIRSLHSELLLLLQKTHSEGYRSPLE